MLVTAHPLKMTSSTRAFVLCTVICVTLFACTTNGQIYSSQYDEIDVDEVLANSRLRAQYVNCILNKGPCITPPARYLKENYAEAFLTKCKLCTEKQKMFFDKVADWFTRHDSKSWNRAVELAIEERRAKGKCS